MKNKNSNKTQTKYLTNTTRTSLIAVSSPKGFIKPDNQILYGNIRVLVHASSWETRKSRSWNLLYYSSIYFANREKIRKYFFWIYYKYIIIRVKNVNSFNPYCESDSSVTEFYLTRLPVFSLTPKRERAKNRCVWDSDLELDSILHFNTIQNKK